MRMIQKSMFFLFEHWTTETNKFWPTRQFGLGEDQPTIKKKCLIKTLGNPKAR